jgi:hypothetical protein
MKKKRREEEEGICNKEGKERRRYVTKEGGRGGDT